MNTPVDFTTAKLLKEKGFNKPCNYYYELQYAHLYPDNDIQTWDRELAVKFKNSYQEGKAAAPTIAEVVMWLYEKHGIWIWVESSMNAFTDNKSHSAYNSLGQFNLPTEAYEAAIKYTLNTLI